MFRKLTFGFCTPRCALLVLLTFLVTFAEAADTQTKKNGPVFTADRLTPDQIRRVNQAIRIHQRNTAKLMASPNVVASGTSIDENGEPIIKVFVTKPQMLRTNGVGIPPRIEGVPVRKQLSGRFFALRGANCNASGDNACAPDERWPLPVPIGVSTGHPNISAGTIGARVTDGSNVFMLSNNHVLANANLANLGDTIIQPGVVDFGNSPDDAVGSLNDFEPINFNCVLSGTNFQCNEQLNNTIDAAIALSTTAELGFTTPLGEHGSTPGYGAPNHRLHAAYGNPTRTGDENLVQLLGARVQKYGRTTGLTTGTVDTINAAVVVCYDDACTDAAQFVDQIVITPGTFSAGGDSGSLIVTNNNARRGVGLLFAGSTDNTIANRIDLVLNRFGVRIDSGPAGNPGAEYKLLCSADNVVDGQDPLCDGAVFDTASHPNGLWVYMWPEDPSKVNYVQFSVNGNLRRRELTAPWELKGGRPIDPPNRNRSFAVLTALGLAGGEQQGPSANFSYNAQSSGGTQPTNFSLLCSSDAIVDGQDPSCDGASFDGASHPNGIWVYLWPENPNEVNNVEFTLNGRTLKREYNAPWELKGGKPIVPPIRNRVLTVATDLNLPGGPLTGPLVSFTYGP